MDVFTLSMVKTGRSGDDVLSVAKREVSSLTSFRTRSWLSACTSRREEGIHSDFEQQYLILSFTQSVKIYIYTRLLGVLHNGHSSRFQT